MPISMTQYFCDKCKKKFYDYEEALKCEKSHGKAKRMIWHKYDDKNLEYVPSSIAVEFEDELHNKHAAIYLFDEFIND